MVWGMYVDVWGKNFIIENGREEFVNQLDKGTSRS